VTAVSGGESCSAEAGASGPDGLILRFVEVSKVYRTLDGEVEALVEVNLSVEEGEYVCLVGPSGSGKTTLLNLAGGLDRPTEGQVIFRGRDLAQLSRAELARLRLRHVGFVFQTYNLMEGLSALDNVRLPLALAGVPEREQLERARELLERVGLGDRMDHKPCQLSGGQQQRVAIARALANRPSLLLADEPTGNLDSETGQKIISLLREVNRSGGVTVICATHDPALAQVADRMVRIIGGRISGEEEVEAQRSKRRGRGRRRDG